MNDKIKESINILQQKRKLFHSEDDFKFEFSRVLLNLLADDYEIRLERPQDITMTKRDGSSEIKRAPIDIIVLDKIKNTIYPIELKYKTKKFETFVQNENYKLALHGAPDIGRHSFRKDIYRVEQLVYNLVNSPHGYFIVITNDKSYLQDISEQNNLDKNFSFHNDTTLQKVDLGWNYEKQFHEGWSLNSQQELIKDGKKHWTSTGNEFYKLDLQSDYKIKWDIYSQVNDETFYISIVDIEQ